MYTIEQIQALARQHRKHGIATIFFQGLQLNTALKAPLKTITTIDGHKK